MQSSLEDYSNHCRLCLNELSDSKIYLYGDENIPTMLSQCTTISISTEDGLMQHMCVLCSQKLQNCFTFKEKCESVDKFLRELLTTCSQLSEDACDSVGTQSQFLCNLCNKTFTRNTSLQIHLERHRKMKAHKCDTCPKTFTTRQDLKIHQSRHTNSALFKCHTCARTYKSKSAVVKHMRTHSLVKQYLCPYCEKGFHVHDSFQTHLKIHTKENLLSCPICDRRFAARASLHFHLRKHTGEAPFLCSVCGSRFKTKSELGQHEVRHSGVKEEKLKTEMCNYCGKNYSSKSGLNRHKLEHSLLRYQCGECYRQFRTDKDLEIHLVIHTGNFPFCCTTCGKGFNRKNNYQRHLKQHQLLIK